jgi:uncharacterized protein (TIRG00374 family)
VRRSILTLVGLGVSALFAYFAVRDVDFDVFWSALRSSDYWWLIPSLLVLAVAIALRAYRWQLLFPPTSRPPFRATLNAMLIGYFFNNVLPARAGEAARVVALRQSAGTPRAQAAATAITERIFDVVALLVLLFVAAPFLPEVGWLRRAIVAAGVLGALLVIAIVVLDRWRERPLHFVLRPLARVPRFSVERVESMAINASEGLRAMHRPELAVPAFALTMVSWLIAAFSFWLVMPAFGLGLGFGAALLVLITTNLSLVIPSSPGALGVFEAATLVALRAYGVDASQALSYAVVLHAVNFFPYLATGLFVLHGHVREFARA